MLDLFGYPIDFTVNSNRKYKTKFGGILSIAMGIIWCILFFIFGQNCFYKQNPNGYTEVQPNEDALSLTENPFIFGFQLAYTNGH